MNSASESYILINEPLPNYTYSDLIDSGIPITQFRDAAGIKNAGDWKKKGIPKKYQSLIHSIMDEISDVKIQSLSKTEGSCNNTALAKFSSESLGYLADTTISKLSSEVIDAKFNTFVPPELQQTNYVHPLSWNKHIQPEKRSNQETGFKFVSIRELIKNQVPIRWLIKGFLERGGMNLLSGAYGSGKSFVVFDMAFCVAAGIDWNGNKVIQSPVLILAGEGHSGIANRFEALEMKYGIQTPECLHLSHAPAILTDRENTELVSNTVNQICPDAGLVIIDTLNRNFGGLDENSTKDMTVFVNNIDRSFRATGKTVLIVHHSGHNSDRGRGSSALPGACEGEFLVKSNKDGLILSCSKQKNDGQPDAMQFTFKPIPLADDSDGNPVNSVVLEFNGKSNPKSSKDMKLSAQNWAILTSLNEALQTHGVDPSTEIKLKFSGFDSVTGKFQKVVNINHWRDLAFKAITIISKADDDSDPQKKATKLQDAKRAAFKRGLDVLCTKENVVTYGDYAWRIFKD